MDNWTFLTRKNNMGNDFQLSSQELHSEPIKLGKGLYALATLLLSYLHQPECVPYTTVYRSVRGTVSR